jgi:hypothetical protein
MSDESERIWKESFVAWSRYYYGIFVEGMKKTTEIFSQCSWHLARDWKRGIPPLGSYSGCARFAPRLDIILTEVLHVFPPSLEANTRLVS